MFPLCVSEYDQVKLNFTIYDEKNEVVDDQYAQSPFVVQLGHGILYDILEEAICGMKMGEKKRVFLAPEDTFGYIRSDLMIDIPFVDFPFKDATVGQSVSITLQDQTTASFVVKSMNEKMVCLDANPSYLGKTLFYELTVIDIIKA